MRNDSNLVPLLLFIQDTSVFLRNWLCLTSKTFYYHYLWSSRLLPQLILLPLMIVTKFSHSPDQYRIVPPTNVLVYELLDETQNRCPDSSLFMSEFSKILSLHDLNHRNGVRYLEFPILTLTISTWSYTNGVELVNQKFEQRVDILPLLLLRLEYLNLALLVTDLILFKNYLT